MTHPSLLPSLAPFLLPGDRESELGSQRDSRWSFGHGEGTGQSEERDEGCGRRAGEEGAGVRHGYGRRADGEVARLSTGDSFKLTDVRNTLSRQVRIYFSSGNYRSPKS